MMIDDLDVLSYVMTVLAYCLAVSVAVAMVYLGASKDEADE